MDSIHTQLKTLVQLAIADQKFDDIERDHIISIGKANSLSEDEINEIIADGLKRKAGKETLDYSTLDFDEKFEYLYNIVQLMKIDHEVFLSEIRFCESVAEKLGFEKNVISKMSSVIYSDPSITTDRDKLKTTVKKYIN